MASFQEPRSVQVQLYSNSGDLYEWFTDINHSGDILNLDLNVLKIGGLDTFRFTIPRDKDIPITRNNIVQFIVDGVVWDTGYVTDVPLKDQRSPIIDIVGKGFYHRLKEVFVNESYSSQTLLTIVTDLASTYLVAATDIGYNATKISVPTISSITTQFYDKSLWDALNTCLLIANHDYDNAKYGFFIDDEQELVFAQFFTDYIWNMYEGYHYQNPDIKEDISRIINKLYVFRTQLATPDSVQYVATYSDTDSQNRYGVFEKKITLPDYVDTTTITEIKDAIFAQKSIPEKTLNVKNITLNRLMETDRDENLIQHGICGISDSPRYKNETPIAVTNGTFAVERYDLIDRGWCQETTEPMVEDETVAHLINALWGLTEEDQYVGRYAWKAIKNIASGTAAEILQTDNINTSDMHGFIAGETIDYLYVIKVPAASGILLSEISFNAYSYYAAAWNTEESASPIGNYDEWLIVQGSYTINAGAAAHRVELTFNANAELDEYFYVGRIRVIRADYVAPQRGNNAFHFIKTSIGGGGNAIVHLNDNEGTSNMHGLAAGDILTYKAIVIGTQASAVTQVLLRINHYNGSTWLTESIVTNFSASNYDTPVKAEGTFTIPSATIGIYFTIEMDTGQDQYSLVMIKDIELIVNKYRPITLPNGYYANRVINHDCEDAVQPYVLGYAATTFNATFARDIGQKIQGAYSFKHTMISGISVSRVYFGNVTATTDMMGFRHGWPFDIGYFVYVPTAGGPLLSEVELRMDVYYSSAWNTDFSETADNVTTADTWGLLRIKGTIPSNAEAIRIYAHIPVTAAGGEYYYMDLIHIRYPVKLPMFFGKYLLHNRLDNYYVLGAECDALTNWDTAGITNTTLVISSDRNLTNRLVLKFTTTAGSTGEYVEYNPDKPIPFPIGFRLFMYFTTFAAPIQITFYDGAGTEIFVFNSFTQDLLVHDFVTPQTTELEVTDLVPTTDNMEIGYTTTATINQWLRIEEVISSLIHITKIRITILTDTVSTFYIDRLDIESSQHSYNVLQLEEVRYRLSHLGLTADLNFGEKEESLIDSIKGVIKDGNLALQIFSKQ